MPQEKYAHKILIVEDEQAMLDSLVDNLQGAGFGHILQARDGQSALSIALREDLDLILLDIILPKMDGMTMLKNLRADPRGKKVRVILLTNLSADDQIMQGIIKDEPSYYLVKTDHSIAEVIEKVKATLNIR